ncbi:MAG: metallophosphoesterase, partial [Phycisphaerae bacterium]
TRPVIPIRGLPDGFDGLTISQLTDTHLGLWISIDRFSEMIRAANRTRPDVIILTGDLVSRSDKITDAMGDALSKLAAPLGVYAVHGNHDYWTDVQAITHQLRRGGVRVLMNEHVLLRRGRDVLPLVGLDDLWDGQPDLESAVAGLPGDSPRIVLEHNPDYAEQMPGDVRVDLMISGHTHGGQVRLPGDQPILLPVDHRKYAAGLVKGPHCPVYVSRGLGVIGPGVRFNCRPELPTLTLRKA